MLPRSFPKAGAALLPASRTGHTDERHHEELRRKLHSVTATLLDCNKIDTILLQTPYSGSSVM